MNNIKKVAVYIRVSSDKQAQTGDSLREQEDTLMEFVTKREDLIHYSTYIDDGISGQKLQRDEFTRLLSDIQNNQIDLIIFTKLDRWFRSLRHYLNTQEILEKNNVAWTAVSQPFFDTTSAHGRAFVAQSMTWAELEAQTGAERVRAVFENKVKQGEVISGSTPIGYSIENKKLIPNEDKDKAIAIFNHYRKHNNLNETARFMNDELNITRTITGIRRMLQNTKYIGTHRNNTNFCEPIIETKVFEQVQTLLSKNIKGDKKNDYIFQGILHCAECGKKMESTMRSTYSGKRKDGTYIQYPKQAMYRCRYAYQHPKCTNTKIFKEHILEDYFLKNIQGLVEGIVNDEKIDSKKEIDTSVQIKNIENKLERLKKAYLNEVIDLDEYKIDKNTLQTQLSKIDVLDKKEEKNLDHLTDFLSNNIDSLFLDLSKKEKRRIILSLVEYITLTKDRDIIISVLK